jgi:hypothetical protein
MSDVLDVIRHALEDAVLMAWQVWWALVFGFAISAIEVDYKLALNVLGLIIFAAMFWPRRAAAARA